MLKMSKCKKLFKKMTIGSKITTLYTLLFSVVLILISCFIIGNTWIYYNSVSKNEIIQAADKVEQYIMSSGEITKDKINRIVDNNYIKVVVTIRDSNNNESTMTRPDEFPPDIIPANRNWGNIENNGKEKNFSIKEISKAEYMFAHRRVNHNNKTYFIDVFRLFNHEQYMINLFLIVFIICNIIAVFLSYVIGRYISNKTLKPIRDVIETADNISINDLAQRIEVPEADDEIKKLIITFNDMISRLDNAFEQHKQFISDASHELKTPIAVIQGYINLIDRWGKSDKEILTESIESIKAETEHMNNLIQQLLFLARADNNKSYIHIENISLNLIAEDVIRDINVLDSNITTKLSVEDDVVISGDYNLIRQLIWIFCENAIKYHSEKPLEITITLGHDNGRPFFSIKDNGIGIDEKSLPHIFDRFYRADKSRNKTIEGNGLGLSIADWIIKNHKAEIKVYSQLNLGSEFIVTFN